MKKSEEMRLKSTINESTRASLRGSPSPMGKATIRGCRFSRIVRTNTRICGKRIPTDKAFPNGEGLQYESTAIPKIKPSPCGEGGERSEPDRVLAV